MMKTKKLQTICTSMCLAIGLSACSRPDVSGVWIPEKVSSNQDTFEYYEIKKMENTDRYQFTEYSYHIKPYLALKIKIPDLNYKRDRVLVFTKDKTYCVEGSLNTVCIVSINDNKLDIYNSGPFIKSASNPPKIPVNK